MNNPTATAITHVLNNKLEFPFCNGVDDLLIVSLGNGEIYNGSIARKSATSFIKIAGEGVSDMVMLLYPCYFVTISRRNLNIHAHLCHY